MTHKAGFVTLIGRPNAGKSTLLNALLGQKLSIVTPKAQTTRRRIRGILSGDHYQIVFSDTPGVIAPHYLLHKKMMDYVGEAFKDADLLIYLSDVTGSREEELAFLKKLGTPKAPLFIILNKVDLSTQEKTETAINFWKENSGAKVVMPLSALQKFNTEELVKLIMEYLPESPPYFPKDELTDQPERFFVAEIIREKIFLNFKEEVPYSAEVVIESYKDEPKITRINAAIVVARDSQKAILIGHRGAAIKRVGTDARKDIEKFIGKKVFLELFVKVREDWRDKENFLKDFGY